MDVMRNDQPVYGPPPFAPWPIPTMRAFEKLVMNTNASTQKSPVPNSNAELIGLVAYALAPNDPLAPPNFDCVVEIVAPLAVTVLGVPLESVNVVLPLAPSMCCSSETLLKYGSASVLGHVPARLSASASRNVQMPLAAELNADAAGRRLNPIYPPCGLFTTAPSSSH